MAIVLDGRVPAAGAVLMSVTRMVRLCSAHVVLSFVGPWYPHAGQHLIPWRAPARYEAGRQRADLPRLKKCEYLSGAARPAPQVLHDLPTTPHQEGREALMAGLRGYFNISPNSESLSHFRSGG